MQHIWLISNERIRLTYEHHFKGKKKAQGYGKIGRRFLPITIEPSNPSFRNPDHACSITGHRFSNQIFIRLIWKIQKQRTQAPLNICRVIIIETVYVCFFKPSHYQTEELGRKETHSYLKKTSYSVKTSHASIKQKLNEKYHMILNCLF